MVRSEVQRRDFQIKESPSHDQTTFVIQSTMGDSGTLKLFDVDLAHQRARWEISIPESFKSSSQVLPMAWICLEYVFENLKLRKIQAEVVGSDQLSLELHRKLGFCQEGCLTRHIQRDGKFWDLILLAHFKDQWEKRKKNLEEVLFELEVRP